jgi:hypothetical protein
MSIKDCIVLASMACFDCTDHILGFMGLGKPSSPVTTLSSRPPYFEVVRWRENEEAQDDGRVR